MSLSSQSGPPQGPNSSQSRHLQTPEERFGNPPSLPLETETVPDPFAAPPPKVQAPTTPRPVKGARSKARHERQRFDREAHHLAPRRVAQTRGATAGGTTHSDAAPSSESKAQPASPTLERIRGERRRLWKRISALTAVALLAGVGAAALFAAPMNIEQVQISGLHATSPVLIKPIAARLLGHNVFRANKGAIAQSVERLPTVESARVVLHAALPPRVELQVIEREPIVRVGAGTTWWVADKMGMPYRPANAHDARLPALTWDGDIQGLKPLDAKRWEDAMRLVDAVEGQNGASKSGGGLGHIHAMELDTSGDAILTLAEPNGAGDLTLKLGNDQWSEKLARASVAMTYFARTKRQAAELNLIALNLPRWTPRGAVSSTPAPTPMT